MAAVDLHFHEGPVSEPASALPLVFGAPLLGVGDTFGVIAVALNDVPLSTVTAASRVLQFGTIAASLNDVPLSAVAGMLNLAVYRGPRRTISATWQEATPLPLECSSTWVPSTPMPLSVTQAIVDATPLPDVQVSTAWEEAARAGLQRRTSWQPAQRLQVDQVAIVAQQSAPLRFQRSTGWQGAQAERPPTTTMRWQETARVHRKLTTDWQEAAPVHRAITSRAHDAAGLVRSWVLPWEEAKRPPPGHSVITPPVIPPDLCYTPPAGDHVPLVFTTAWDGSTELTFVCDNHTTPPGGTVVVPIQEVYMISNDVSLVLASDGTVIPTRSFSLSLDYTSWSWSFTARVPRAALPIFDMDAGGDPKVLTATVNGTEFSIIAESVASDRQFNTADVTITGRGLIAGLADPYAPTLTFGNPDADRTAQQLVADVLTINGVPLGWAVDWQLTDWLVPAAAWSFQGTYMAAVQAIAAAAGGYVQPTGNDQTVRILPLFPTAPWTWDALVPDYSLPAAVVSHEGITWSDLPDYNRVFVSGTNGSGVLGDVKRAGTAGDFEKPMVTDQLITHADAARQRGIAELAVGGRSALVSLKLPVLTATGVILPGKTVGYVDGAVTRKGIVRSVAIEAGFPTVYQTIGVETHV